MSGRIGLAFSGGGIRSAAFCSGVLRRLLQREVKVNYLSCVSGGGYTGTAYLDWKFRNGQRDDPKWHRKFFDNMRKRAGIFCNWQKPVSAVFDSLFLLGLILTVSVILPVIVWMAYALPVAYVVDFFVGDLLRAKPICPGGFTLDAGDSIEPDCHEPAGTAVYTRIMVFVTLFSIGFVSFVVERALPRGKSFFKLLSTCSLVIFALVLLPWMIHDFLESTPVAVQVLILVLAALVWFSFPVLRRQASLVMVIYAYSFVIHTRVFHHTFLGFEYSEYSFNKALLVSALVLWMVPFVGSLQQRLVNVFNRWRLQKAFYTPESVGVTGCGGISCGDIWIGFPKFKGGMDKSYQPLTLADLEDLAPMYISNTTVNTWRRSPSDKHPFEILTLTPREIRRLDSPYSEDAFMDKLEPDVVMLSEAMAMSAAAVSQRMGKYDKDKEVLTDFKIILGIAMGASILSDPPSSRKENYCIQMMPFIIETVRILPFVGFLLVCLLGGEEKWVAIGVFSYFAILLPYTILALFPTGAAKPGVMEKIIRWFVIHVPYIRYVRNMMGTVDVGPMPPPILRISDGGHMENLGLLPLFRMRLPRIVVVNGGVCETDADYGASILNALQLARDKLRCSFLSLDGRDIIEDIRVNFVDKKPGEQPRSHRFKVAYYDYDPEDGTEKRVGEGEVTFLAPRHPNKGVKIKEPVTWKDALHDIDTDLEAGQWGTGPELTAEEADRLTFCFCECCHCLVCKSLSNLLCGTFPLHSTGNQGFTPAMFSAYHREGYRACVEAKADEFLKQP